MDARMEMGCERCFRAAARAASEARRDFVEVVRLIDESHLVVRILACPHCGQRCFSVFTELIDWSQGDDAQYWSLMPVTLEESERLIEQGEKVDLRLIEALGPMRRYLRIECPTGGVEAVFWAAGPVKIGVHD